jgi:hypothetical protein
VVTALNNKMVKLTGFLVTLEGDGKPVSEFLLVPFFGACIHVPPPSNQIVLVRTKPFKVKEVRTGVARNDLASASYVLEATHVESLVTLGMKLKRSCLVLLLAFVAAGCATTSRQPAVAQNPSEMTGSWHGWLIKARGFDWINLDIRRDGSFELSGGWGIQSAGVLVVRHGTVRFEGSRAWRGTLVLVSSPAGQALKLQHDNRTEYGTLHREPPS